MRGELNANHPQEEEETRVLNQVALLLRPWQERNYHPDTLAQIEGQFMVENIPKELEGIWVPVDLRWLWWCNTHRRRATHKYLKFRYGRMISEEHCCAPKQPGIMMPCECVNLTGIAEIEEV